MKTFYISISKGCTIPNLYENSLEFYWTGLKENTLSDYRIYNVLTLFKVLKLRGVSKT